VNNSNVTDSSTPRVSRAASIVAVAIALGSLCLTAPASAQVVTSSINSNFNGTAIAAGRYIWFNAVFSYSGPTATNVVIRCENQTITFTANAVNYTLNLPDSKITLSTSTSASQATTVFDAMNNNWLTTAPISVSGNVFLGGLSYLVPVNFPGGINPVTWKGDFSADTPNVSLNWKWGAAVYTTFSGDHTQLGAKPLDVSTSQYMNSDHAGTPESFKSFVTGGARGGGGSNFTGSYSGTANVNLTFAVAVESTAWQRIKELYR